MAFPLGGLRRDRSYQWSKIRSHSSRATRNLYLLWPVADSFCSLLGAARVSSDSGGLSSATSHIPAFRLLISPGTAPSRPSGDIGGRGTVRLPSRCASAVSGDFFESALSSTPPRVISRIRRFLYRQTFIGKNVEQIF